MLFYSWLAIFYLIELNSAEILNDKTGQFTEYLEEFQSEYIKKNPIMIGIDSDSFAKKLTNSFDETLHKFLDESIVSTSGLPFYNVVVLNLPSSVMNTDLNKKDITKALDTQIFSSSSVNLPNDNKMIDQSSNQIESNVVNKNLANYLTGFNTRPYTSFTNLLTTAKGSPLNIFNRSNYLKNNSNSTQNLDANQTYQQTVSNNTNYKNTQEFTNYSIDEQKNGSNIRKLDSNYHVGQAPIFDTLLLGQNLIDEIIQVPMHLLAAPVSNLATGKPISNLMNGSNVSIDSKMNINDPYRISGIDFISNGVNEILDTTRAFSKIPDTLLKVPATFSNAYAANFAV